MINEWWIEDAGERYWMEITNRSDIGENLIAPKAADNGAEYWSYTLVNHVIPGDIVFHWDKNAGPGIVGYSVVKDEPFSSTIRWQSRGTYGRANAPTGKPKSEPGWEALLTGYVPLPAPVTQERLRQLEAKVRAVRDQLSAEIDGPIYFPYALSDKRPLRAAQGYLVKFPQALVEAIPELDKVRELAEGPHIPAASGSTATSRTASTGRLRDPIRKKAIETHAVKTVMNLWDDDGYEVEDVGLFNPWDITATKDGIEIHIEVKGSSVTRETVDLTDGEVRHAEGHSPTILVVVDQINVTSTNECSGGRVRIWEDWLPDRNQLIPTAYRYPLPE
ncbi:protein NO VEIN domain-containing protein [Nocardioides luteus]|uniref:protein NO VEIN domain-containing protein n=1 Tax=Nocardioides luteus TaxID=1844 RepID=UPI0018CB8B54|nr:DUF3883 domain-containing protein [Nocardioides luteus]MBG6098330.1 hypothetical protein [Nocardioides luteus]